MTTIPASQLVSVQPGVISAGGSPLSLNSIFLTHDTAVPIGTILPFPSAIAVSNFFGATSTEAALAAVYFNGFDNSNVKPGQLIFAQFNPGNVAAYLRGGSVASMTLAQLQALSGTITLTIDGAARTSAAINLSAAASFSAAAALITTGFSGAGGAICTYDAQRAAFVITSPTTGAGSTITTASVGTLATGLLLTTATGGITSQGAAAAVEATFMTALTILTQNWVSFMTVWEPITASKQAFAVWSNGQGQRYLYVAWDSDVTPANTFDATTSFGNICKVAQYDGVALVWNTAALAAFLCGAIASVDFNQKNGRVTFAYKSQSGMSATVTDVTKATNLANNGYNFYGAYATANQAFTFLQTGSLVGKWLWIDSFINQVYMNSQLQLAGVELMTNTKSLPYNNSGYEMVRAAFMDPINQAINFGAIVPGVVLSAAQAAEVNLAAGVKIDNVLTAHGFYLQVLPATAQVRGLRQSPPCTLWYMDGQSIQKLNLASIDVQ